VALLPTLLAVGIGVALGVRWGGRPDQVLEWRPALPRVGAGGLTLTVVLAVLPLSGGFATLLLLVATGLLLAFAVVNVRTGGMVVVAAGLGLNFLVTLLNWGMPVSLGALESAGILPAEPDGDIVLNGGRELADGGLFGFLGGVIPLPWGQVISLGDLLVLIGLALVVASVLRGYEVGGGSGRRGLGGRSVGVGDYRNALDALGRGPAPRRGPGLHPSRLPTGSRGRSRSGRATR
jgi:hypothetical protein